MKNPVTLSVHGIVRSPKMALSVLLSDALTSYASQCYLFNGITVSIPFYVNSYATRPDTLVGQLEVALQSYFEKYFKEVVVSVRHDSTPDNPLYKLSLSVHAVHESRTYDIADSFDIKDSAIVRTINAFNGDENRE
jgi:hypothetical protein